MFVERLMGMVDKEISEIIDFIDSRDWKAKSDERKVQITHYAFDTHIAPLTDEIREIAFQKLYEAGRDDIVERFKPLARLKHVIDYSNDSFMHDLIGFIDRRAEFETDSVDRNITMELAWDRFVAREGSIGRGNIFVKLQKYGRDDLFRRFKHLTHIEEYDLDNLAMKDVESPHRSLGR